MWSIGAVAKRTGVTASAIRYYEAHGLLNSERQPNGYRVYDGDAIASLLFLRRAQRFGITLDEIKQLLDLSRQGQQPCARVRQLARHHLDEVETRLRELQSLRQSLRVLATRRVASRRRGEVCPIIERGSR
jgi:DNA-binding transcriptional MerR regulator